MHGRDVAGYLVRGSLAARSSQVRAGRRTRRARAPGFPASAGRPGHRGSQRPRPVPATARCRRPPSAARCPLSGPARADPFCRAQLAEGRSGLARAASGRWQDGFGAVDPRRASVPAHDVSRVIAGAGREISGALWRGWPGMGLCAGPVGRGRGRDHDGDAGDGAHSGGRCVRGALEGENLDGGPGFPLASQSDRRPSAQTRRSRQAPNGGSGGQA
jgi:hypothetical protein